MTNNKHPMKRKATAAMAAALMMAGATIPAYAAPMLKPPAQQSIPRATSTPVSQETAEATTTNGMIVSPTGLRIAGAGVAGGNTGGVAFVGATNNTSGGSLIKKTGLILSGGTAAKAPTTAKQPAATPKPTTTTSTTTSVKPSDDTSTTAKPTATQNSIMESDYEKAVDKLEDAYSSAAAKCAAMDGASADRAKTYTKTLRSLKNTFENFRKLSVPEKYKDSAANYKSVASLMTSAINYAIDVADMIQEEDKDDDVDNSDSISRTLTKMQDKLDEAESDFNEAQSDYKSEKN